MPRVSAQFQRTTSTMPPLLRSLLPLLLLTLLWAGLYLPGLGETELKGEEPRRIMPGLHMLQSGDWLHTVLGDTPYYRKPPLVNWAIAASVALTGQYNEFAYRLPSVLAVLTLVLGAWAITRPWLGAEGAFLAGLFILSNISMLEKGRLAEIEAIYIACSGLATAWWLAAFAKGGGGWKMWVVPGFLLGLGMLAKAPLHLIFFYGVVLGVCASTRAWRALRHPAHFLCIALTLGIFALWAIPYLQSTAGESAATTGQASAATDAWATQLASRFGGDDFKWGDWLLNIPRGVMNLLPWALFFPLLWNRDWLAHISDERERQLIRGARNGTVIAFILVSLMPGALERYTLPLLVPIFLLLGRVMAARSVSEYPAWMPKTWLWVNIVIGGLLLGVVILSQVITFVPLSPIFGWLAAAFLMAAAGVAVSLLSHHAAKLPMLGLASAIVLAAAVFIYAAFTPSIGKGDNLRPIRSKVLDHVPAGATLWVQDGGWRPFWVYMEPEARFFRRTKEAPFGPEPLAVVVRFDNAERFLRDSRFKTRPGQLAQTFVDSEANQYGLVLIPAAALQTP